MNDIYGQPEVSTYSKFKSTQNHGGEQVSVKLQWKSPIFDICSVLAMSKNFLCFLHWAHHLKRMEFFSEVINWARLPENVYSS